MARNNRLDSKLPLIELFFDDSAKKSFTEKKFGDLLHQNRDDWKIPSDIYAMQLLDYLIKRKKIHKNNFTDSSGDRKIIYSWKTEDEFTVISGLKHESYYSYYSALYLHQLTLQIPKTIYLNFEHAASSDYDKRTVGLSQEAIDGAFKHPQRKSSISYTYKDKKIILTNGKYTNKLGVLGRMDSDQAFLYTDLERTLIDISVRPVYAGGIFEVLEAFRIAKDRVDVKKMASYFEELAFIYPYHQAIGFYMEKADYAPKDIDLFRKKVNFDFYLTYGIRNKEYSADWRLYYPKGV